ncbi:small guanosine triphosphatase family (GTPase)-like Ras family protein (macronuclear) [Tetrahymena thermophila SB210]|uniref:Small guanosine triphosphatase family (GTPase)-like Ras family protein n=2 Tax=Tetrahymena thermophila TaxID=5911 RepID=Q23FM5_TETTS|nr:small guanosine triphosphatase family (GTPase)-like Ras family protein [Tetrahymena thermophila SB210]EAR95585.1 small guanosine triphosphatase family (GTPase)-like Ras family protein [Tetrahymena thermophila SB210]BAJ21297.1 Rab-family small GTPase Rab6B [Tetrahymena thermophila]|eukprot:XP_001015830.1 small guanosine triphosphatase family (GTPase)-like Ras family protein [Tetrahymena thermophila SB210]
MQNTTTGPVVKFKIVFLGDQSVGKTSIINRFIYDNFTGSEQPTVGIDFICKTLQMDNKTLRLQLWDTAGQERFKSLIPSYIRDSNAAIIVYDITNQNSFSNVTKWVEEVKEERGNNAFIFILGNKSDLEDRKVSLEEGQAKAKQFGLNFCEVSAKTGQNISSFFKNLSMTLSGGNSNETPNQQLQTDNKSGQPQQPSNNNDNANKGQKLQNPSKTDDKDKKKKGGCC